VTSRSNIQLPPLPTFCVVIVIDPQWETDGARMRDTLDNLESQGSLIYEAKDVFVAPASPAMAKVLDELHPQYPWLTVVSQASSADAFPDLTAVAQTSSDLIIFCASHLRYEPQWLSQLVRSFMVRPDACLVAGETTTPIWGIYGLALGLTYAFPRFTRAHELVPTTLFWSNNFAIRRSLFARTTPAEFVEKFLSRTGIPAQTAARGAGTALRQSMARAWHPCPRFSQVLRRYRQRGHELELLRRNALHGIDEAPLSWAMAPDRAGDSLVRKFLGRIRQVVVEQPARLLILPFAVPLVLLLLSSYFAGRRSARTSPTA